MAGRCPNSLARKTTGRVAWGAVSRLRPGLVVIVTLAGKPSLRPSERLGNVQAPKRQPVRSRAKHIEIRIDGPIQAEPGNHYRVVVWQGSRVIQKLIPSTLIVCMAKAREMNRKNPNCATVEYIKNESDVTS